VIQIHRLSPADAERRRAKRRVYKKRKCERDRSVRTARASTTIREEFGTDAALTVLEGYDDLPDGAYFAVAEELGLSVEDFVGDDGNAK
jgi:hypothetical protein